MKTAPWGVSARPRGSPRAGGDQAMPGSIAVTSLGGVLLPPRRFLPALGNPGPPGMALGAPWTPVQGWEGMVWCWDEWDDGSLRVCSAPRHSKPRGERDRMWMALEARPLRRLPRVRASARLRSAARARQPAPVRLQSENSPRNRLRGPGNGPDWPDWPKWPGKPAKLVKTARKPLKTAKTAQRDRGMLFSRLRHLGRGHRA